MIQILKYAAAVALTGALVVAMATPSDARRARRAVVVPTPVVITPGFGGTSSGCYYSQVCNPRFGYVAELGYSNAVSFRIYPHSD
jgi:hypothetical protein